MCASVNPSLNIKLHRHTYMCNSIYINPWTFSFLAIFPTDTRIHTSMNKYYSCIHVFIQTSMKKHLVCNILVLARFNHTCLCTDICMHTHTHTHIYTHISIHNSTSIGKDLSLHTPLVPRTFRSHPHPQRSFYTTAYIRTQICINLNTRTKPCFVTSSCAL